MAHTILLRLLLPLVIFVKRIAVFHFYNTLGEPPQSALVYQDVCATDQSDFTQVTQIEKINIWILATALSIHVLKKGACSTYVNRKSPCKS
jgi:hypothetical protein